MSVNATAVLKKETQVDPGRPNDKSYRAVLSVLDEKGKEFGLPRYFSDFREVAVLLRAQQDYHEQFHERFASFQTGEEVTIPLTLVRKQSGISGSIPGRRESSCLSILGTPHLSALLSPWCGRH